VGTATTASYSDLGLTASTSYSYQIRATDAAGNLSAFSNTASATTSAAGGAASIAYVQGTYQTPDSASSVSVTYASAQASGDLNVVSVGWSDSVSTVQSITDSQGNNYVAAVGPTSSTGNASLSIYYAKNIAAAAANANTVTVTFSGTVSYPEVRVLEYSGLDPNNPFDVGIGASGTGTAQNSGSVTTTNANDLLVAFNYLDDSTTASGTGYTQRLITNGGDLVEDQIVTSTGSYSATSTQGGADWWVMQLAAFRAASTGGGNTTPPTAPSGLTTTVVSATEINLSWTASTDNVGVTGYLVERCSGTSCTTFTQIGTSTTTTYSDVGLTGSTSYSYRVRATDAAGNLSSYSGTSSGNTSSGGGGDTTPPTAPTGVSPSVVSASQINLTWTASTDNVGVTGYQIQRCAGSGCTAFVQIGTSPTTSYSDTGLAASTSYSYQIQATDAAGNLSGFSSTATATTPAAGDTQPPSNPTNLVATAGPMDTVLTWTASTDNVGVTGYFVERCEGVSCTNFAQIATVSGSTTTYTDSGVTADASYAYRVRATDAAGNLSGYSTSTSDTPLDCD
jgi:chitodextrinase